MASVKLCKILTPAIEIQRWNTRELSQFSFDRPLHAAVARVTAGVSSSKSCKRL